MPNHCGGLIRTFISKPNLICIEIPNQINILTLLRLSTPTFGTPAFVLEPFIVLGLFKCHVECIFSKAILSSLYKMLSAKFPTIKR